MNERLDEITEQIEKHNNVLLYKEELYEYYKKLKQIDNTVYISTPRKGKTALEQILKTADSSANTKNKSISKILEEIAENTKTTKLMICIDNFEQLSKRELPYYRELEQQDNIQLIVNINEDREFIDAKFLDKFVILNSNFLNNRSQSVNITSVILLLFSFLILILFLKIQLSIIRFIISGLWFTLLMYRSFYYMTK